MSKDMKHINKKNKFNFGFTLVELLIVIVIIGVISAILFVSYTGVQDKAIASSLQSDLNSASDLIRVYQAHDSNGYFPTTLIIANNGVTMPASKDTTYTAYQFNNTNTPKTFCLAATRSGKSYSINQEGVPSAGPCPVLQLDAGIATSYPGTGTVLTDLSGNGNTGNINGAVYTNTNGGVLNFDGVNDYVNSADLSWSSTDSFSISLWINANNLTAIKGVIGKVSPDWEWTIFTNGGILSFNYYTTAGAYGINISTANILLTNQWYFVTVTYNGSQGLIYINDTQKASALGTGIWQNRTTNMQIGFSYSPNGSNYYYSGSIGNISIYNKSLSADEVSRNFNALRSRYGI